MILRRADSQDFPELLPMVRDFHLGFGFGWNPGTKPALLEAALKPDAPVQIWCSVDSGGIAGYLVVATWFSLEFEGTVALLDEFYLKPERRGQGLGEASLEALEKELCRDGFRFLRLEVDDVHARAAGLYSRRGFVPGRTLWTRRLGDPLPQPRRSAGSG